MAECHRLDLKSGSFHSLTRRINHKRENKIVALRSENDELKRQVQDLSEKIRIQQRTVDQLIDKYYNKNADYETEVTRARQAEIKLQNQQVEFARQEAEKPKRILLARLQLLLDIKDPRNLTLTELDDLYKDGRQLLNEYKGHCLVGKGSFEATNQITILEGFINLIREQIINRKDNPTASQPIGFAIDLTLLKNNLRSYDTII